MSDFVRYLVHCTWESHLWLLFAYSLTKNVIIIIQVLYFLFLNMIIVIVFLYVFP